MDMANYFNLPTDQYGETIPRILYKYRDWKNDLHKRIVTNEEIYFSSIKELNDPFDGAVTFRFDLEPKKELLEHVKFLMNILYPSLDKNTLKKNAQSFCNTAKSKDSNFLELFKKATYCSHCETGGIFSCTSDPKNYLMWSMYANGHRGFVVGIDTYILEDYFLKEFAPRSLTPAWLKVKYVEVIPDILPVKLSHTEYFSKSFSYKLNAFEYEKEYRCFLFNFPSTTIKLPKEAIKIIILGNSISQKDAEQIIEYSRKIPEVQIFHARIPQKELILEKL